ncbi:uncharacterized protein LY89DRAFT_736986 [Mollisia scopiformis]|uniref:Uncharacterized protein n=1 Tax=Mollisia scopiformis TaxID=149040 RepID=A0A194X1W8_MOLSC|nr:uncharacterized protein LY89DRAFT_736986 [Mollisia scopiformis]KUJ13984.1 hypothetical protein LY89DRAFT_736986 [Mollisia scopiformis]
MSVRNRHSEISNQSSRTADNTNPARQQVTISQEKPPAYEPGSLIWLKRKIRFNKDIVYTISKSGVLRVLDRKGYDHPGWILGPMDDAGTGYLVAICTTFTRTPLEEWLVSRRLRNDMHHSLAMSTLPSSEPILLESITLPDETRKYRTLYLGRGELQKQAYVRTETILRVPASQLQPYFSSPTNEITPRLSLASFLLLLTKTGNTEDPYFLLFGRLPTISSRQRPRKLSQATPQFSYEGAGVWSKEFSSTVEILDVLNVVPLPYEDFIGTLPPTLGNMEESTEMQETGDILWSENVLPDREDRQDESLYSYAPETEEWCPTMADTDNEISDDEDDLEHQLQSLALIEAAQFHQTESPTMPNVCAVTDFQTPKSESGISFTEDVDVITSVSRQVMVEDSETLIDLVEEAKSTEKSLLGSANVAQFNQYAKEYIAEIESFSLTYQKVSVSRKPDYSYWNPTCTRRPAEEDISEHSEDVHARKRKKITHERPRGDRKPPSVFTCARAAWEIRNSLKHPLARARGITSSTNIPPNHPETHHNEMPSHVVNYDDLVSDRSMQLTGLSIVATPDELSQDDDGIQSFGTTLEKYLLKKSSKIFIYAYVCVDFLWIGGLAAAVAFLEKDTRRS